MAEQIVQVQINGEPFSAPEGATVLAALQLAGKAGCRTSVSGEPRGGLCGIGICFECRVRIDGVSQQRACMTVCRNGMEIVADG
ncbi:MAG TPA: (2Fe-2S)-binding protein [Fimbriimonadaceae bacterium]|nr:(2Fe-2S)-binding protein [Fimbriimonadaceae bacterium]